MKVVLDGGGRFIPLQPCHKINSFNSFLLVLWPISQKNRLNRGLKTSQSHMKYSFFMSVCLGSHILAVIFKR